MIRKLAPRTWQAAVVAALVHTHEFDRDDARQICWRMRFQLTAKYNARVPADVAAKWVSDGS